MTIIIILFHYNTNGRIVSWCYKARKSWRWTTNNGIYPLIKFTDLPNFLFNGWIFLVVISQRNWVWIDWWHQTSFNEISIPSMLSIRWSDISSHHKTNESGCWITDDIRYPSTKFPFPPHFIFIVSSSSMLLEDWWKWGNPK